jgi:hypothetical protein
MIQQVVSDNLRACKLFDLLRRFYRIANGSRILSFKWALMKLSCLVMLFLWFEL